MLSFLLVVGAVSLLHYPLESWGLLHVPKMVIMLMAVVFIFLVCGVLSGGQGQVPVAQLSFLPLLILTLTAERFARTITEDGPMSAGQLML